MTDMPELAVRALIRWRREWERNCCEPPSRGNGQTSADLNMWRVAGRLMRIRGIKTRLPDER